jgi:predicted ribosomally synthesized peptide with nif11-like leader
MSEEQAVRFFDQLEKDEALRAKIKLGLETLAKIAAGYNVTEEELTAELRKRWECQSRSFTPYSEPPGF